MNDSFMNGMCMQINKYNRVQCIPIGNLEPEVVENHQKQSSLPQFRICLNSTFITVTFWTHLELFVSRCQDTGEKPDIEKAKMFK